MVSQIEAQNEYIQDDYEEIVKENPSLNFSTDRYAQFRTATHLACAIESDAQFTCYAIDTLQSSLPNHVNHPTRSQLLQEDYEPPNRKIMLQTKYKNKWEEAEQDELRSFQHCEVMFIK